MLIQVVNLVWNPTGRTLRRVSGRIKWSLHGDPIFEILKTFNGSWYGVRCERLSGLVNAINRH